MKTDIDKLNECLKALNITNIKFKKTYSFRPEYRYRIGILLPRIGKRKFGVFLQFYGLDEIFEHFAVVYNEIISRRKHCLEDVSNRTGYIFAYHMLTSTDIKFLELLGKCSSLEELELRLGIMGY